MIRIADLLRRLFPSRPSHEAQRRGDTKMDFVSRTGIPAMVDHLVSEVRKSPADKILVVSGFEALRDLDQGLFPSHELLVNRYKYFGWLLRACEYARSSSKRQIIASAFPRRWNPPAIKVVQASFAENVWAIADGNTGGIVHEVVASAMAPFMKDPTNITLNVILPDDTQTTLGVVFLGLTASSYYREVLFSQGCPPRQPLQIQAVSGPGDPALWTKVAKRLFRLREPAAQDRLLRQTSERLEAFCRRLPRGVEHREYNGSLLLPKAPREEDLPWTHGS